MRFEPSPVSGVWMVELDRTGEERDWCGCAFDHQEFAAMGLAMDVVQCNASFSPRVGTLRGMHYQAEPHGEPKLVRCVRGAGYHVALDLRPASASYRRWYGAVLSAESRGALYLPAGVAHGSQTLVEDSEVLYLMGHRHVPEAARGVRWDDPAFAIRWPPVPGGLARLLSERDASYADWRRER